MARYITKSEDNNFDLLKVSNPPIAIPSCWLAFLILCCDLLFFSTLTTERNPSCTFGENQITSVINVRATFQIVNPLLLP